MSESAPGRWAFYSPELAEWFRVNECGGTDAHLKRIPEFIKCASIRQLNIFLDFFGDQSKPGVGPHQYFSTSKPIIDGLQEILLRCGKRSSIHAAKFSSAVRADGVKIDSHYPEIYLTEWTTDHLTIKRGDTLKEDHYKGEVFCATVPNSLLVTRDQGSVLISGNSCTANAIAAAVDFERKKQGESFITPSRLMIYFDERVIEGDPDQDNGAEIRDGIKSVNSQGVCPESEWPYSDADPGPFSTAPAASCYTAALKFKALSYVSVPQDRTTIQTALIGGRPIVFGISCYDGLQSDGAAATGVVPMPGPADSPIGGHAICLVGYSDATRLYTFRNSWGTSWGDGGYGYLPYVYVEDPNLSSDFWQITAEA